MKKKNNDKFLIEYYLNKDIETTNDLKNTKEKYKELKEQVMITLDLCIRDDYYKQEWNQLKLFE